MLTHLLGVNAVDPLFLCYNSEGSETHACQDQWTATGMFVHPANKTPWSNIRITNGLNLEPVGVICSDSKVWLPVSATQQNAIGSPTHPCLTLKVEEPPAMLAFTRSYQLASWALVGFPLPTPTAQRPNGSISATGLWTRISPIILLDGLSINSNDPQHGRYALYGTKRFFSDDRDHCMPEVCRWLHPRYIYTYIQWFPPWWLSWSWYVETKCCAPKTLKLWLWICICIIYVYNCIYIYIHNMYIYLYTCIYIYIHVYIYIYIYMLLSYLEILRDACVMNPRALLILCLLQLQPTASMLHPTSKQQGLKRMVRIYTSPRILLWPMSNTKNMWRLDSFNR